MKIELNHLSKTFGQAPEVLHDINFSDEVTTLAVSGSSGCGKTTLLRILGGLLLPDRGELMIDGVVVGREEKQLQAHRRRLGYVFQQGALFRHLTAQENIALPLQLVHGFGAVEARREAMRLLERFGLADDAEKKPFELSGGQQQRIAIARAIAPRPQLLLLDEPTSALDPEYTTEVLDMVNELREEGARFIIVTHEMGFARHACEKMLFMSQGRILEYGRSADLFAKPSSLELKQFLSKLLEWNVKLLGT